MERTERELIAAVLNGDSGSFEPLVRQHSPRLFAMARRYARRDSEVEDIVQEVWLKAFDKLRSFRGDAPFEHWLMRLAVRTCYDFLRHHQRNKEFTFTDLTEAEQDWLETCLGGPDADPQAAAAKQLIARVMEQLSPPARLVITLLEIEERTVKEIAAMTGWSVPLVKVRAFRARAEMKRVLSKLAKEKYL